MRQALLIATGIIALCLTGPGCQGAHALDVPLTVREADGVARVSNPVNSGVPLPRGAVNSSRPVETTI